MGLGWKKYAKGYLRPVPELDPQIREVSGKKEYIWEIGEVPEILEEDRMPAWADVTDHVFISNFRSWTDIFLWWKGLVEDKLAANKEIKDKVASIVRGSKTLREKAMALYSFVCEDIRYVAVEYGEAGFEPHTASEIFLNKYGDCKDQAVLLLTMLREAGIKCYPVLIGTRGVFELDPEFPTLVFNHAIACCEIDGETVFMDPTSETVSFGDIPAGDQNRKVLVFKEDRAEVLETPLFPSSANRVLRTMNLAVDKDEKIKGERIVQTSGLFNAGQRHWLRYTRKKELEETLKQKLNSFLPGSSLLSYEVAHEEELDKEIILTMQFEGGQYFSSAGDLRIIPLWGDLPRDFTALEERTYPVSFSFLNSEEILIRLNLPPRYTVFYLPEKVEAVEKWFRFSREYRYNDGLLELSQVLSWKLPEIGVKDYPEFRRVWTEILKRSEDKAVLRYTADSAQ